MGEQDSESPDKSNFSTFEGNLFGALLGFHETLMDLLRNSGLKDDKLKLVSDRIKQLLADVTSETERTGTFDLAAMLDSAYDEVKGMVEELSRSGPGR